MNKVCKILTDRDIAEVRFEYFTEVCKCIYTTETLIIFHVATTNCNVFWGVLYVIYEQSVHNSCELKQNY